MKHSNPSIEQLKAMMSLEEKRAALQRELDQIQQKLSALHRSLLGGASVARSTPATKSGPRKRIKRGVLSEKILAALAAAGQAGVRVRDLAAAIGIKAQNIHSWLQSTAKKHPGIRKLSAGVYRLAPGAAPVGAAKGPGKKKKGKGGRRGALAASILAALEAVGSDGISVKDLAGKVGSKYNNVSIWFATTGKKNSKIKKVGPARYKLAA